MNTIHYLTKLTGLSIYLCQTESKNDKKRQKTTCTKHVTVSARTDWCKQHSVAVQEEQDGGRKSSLRAHNYDDVGQIMCFINSLHGRVARGALDVAIAIDATSMMPIPTVPTVPLFQPLVLHSTQEQAKYLLPDTCLSYSPGVNRK